MTDEERSGEIGALLRRYESRRASEVDDLARRLAQVAQQKHRRQQELQGAVADPDLQLAHVREVVSGLVNSVKDPVFRKQLARFEKEKELEAADVIFDPARDRIDDLMRSLRDQIDSLNGSKVPEFVSQAVYVFYKNWRKETCRGITVSYFKILSYYRQMDAARVRRAEETNRKLAETEKRAQAQEKERVVAMLRDFTQTLRDDVGRKNDELLRLFDAAPAAAPDDRI